MTDIVTANADRECQSFPADGPHVLELEESQPQRGFTTKPGVAVTNGAPQENTHKTPLNPNGVAHQKCEFFVRASHVVEPRLGFGEISIFLPGVRRKAATPGFVV